MSKRQPHIGVILGIWLCTLCLLSLPVILAAISPLQAWRDPAYITGAMAGVVALSVLVAQPLLAAGYMPGISRAASRKAHRWLGAALILLVAAHIGGLYLSSPADVMDALLLVSPTPFSIYGVVATAAISATALLALARRRLRPARWRILHTLLALIVVGATVIHAVMIDGAMTIQSKWAIVGCAVIASLVVTVHLRLVRRP